MSMTEAEKAELAELEHRLNMWMLTIHQARLLNSALRREIRISIQDKHNRGPFHRLDKIITFSDAVARTVREARHGRS